MLTREFGKTSARATWRDYYVLTKPGVVQLLVFTAIVGMLLASPGMVSWDVLIFGSLGIALAAASGATVNHILDQRIDAQMLRTRDRPMATGRVSDRDAMAFALALGIGGIGILALAVNPLTALLTFFSLASLGLPGLAGFVGGFLIQEAVREYRFGRNANSRTSSRSSLQVKA